MRVTTILKTLLLAALVSVPALAQETPDTGAIAGPTAEATSETAGPADEETKRKKRPLLFYLPNRIFDLTDMIRARIRVGPGVQLGVRATKPISANVGFYGAVWAGLHGPREKASVALPVGFEAFSGAQASVAKVGTSSPYYGNMEIGGGFIALFAGPDIGVDPIEIVDFLLGWIFIDIRNDDL